MDTTLRPLSTSQVLDRTFSLYRGNFVLFAGMAVVAPALSLVAEFIQLGTFGIPVMPQLGNPDPAAAQSLLAHLFLQSITGAILGLIFYTVGQALATGATVYAVSLVHLGKAATIGESYRMIKPVFGKILRILVAIYFRAFWPIIASYVPIFGMFLALPALTRGAGPPQVALALTILAVSLLSLAGIAGGAVWAVYVYCRYALAIPACVLERLRAGEAMSRSKVLTQGGMWRIVGIYLLTVVMSAILTSVLQVPAYVFGGNIFSMLKPGGHISASFLFWSYLGGFIGRTLAGPIATIAIALVYYDQRVRKEAFDLQLMMENIAPAGSAHVTASGSPA